MAVTILCWPCESMRANRRPNSLRLRLVGHFEPTDVFVLILRVMTSQLPIDVNQNTRLRGAWIIIGRNNLIADSSKSRSVLFVKKLPAIPATLICSRSQQRHLPWHMSPGSVAGLVRETVIKCYREEISTTVRIALAIWHERTCGVHLPNMIGFVTSLVCDTSHSSLNPSKGLILALEYR